MYVMESPDMFEPVSVLRRRLQSASTESPLSTAEAETTTDSDSSTASDADSGLEEAVGAQRPEDFLNVQLRIGTRALSLCDMGLLMLSVIIYMWIVVYQIEQLRLLCSC